MAWDIPFNRPCFAGNEQRYMAEAVRNGHLSGDGPFTRRCQRLLEEQLGVPAALLTSSCTDALEMCALLLDFQPGDEVIVPSFSFVSAANAFALRGAAPRFADIRPDTLNIDETRLAPLLTSRTRAIVAVHYAGVACEMEALAAHGVDVVEDNAHGLFGKYKGGYLGAFGSLATLSFHETKNFTCGEGGALLINRPEWIARAEILREKGTDRSRFFRGEVDKYSWVDLGSSYLPSDLSAAFLYAQLEARGRIQAARARIWAHYCEHLRAWAAENGVRLPCVPAHCEQPFHMFYLLMPDAESRQALIEHLKAHGILSVFHYLPLHLSEMGRKAGGRPGDCPVAESVSSRLLRLPFYNDLTEQQQSRVIAAVRNFVPTRRRAALI
jgi:dTDP-4-amino-4,6-dideoxygalactose transaminase